MIKFGKLFKGGMLEKAEAEKDSLWNTLEDTETVSGIRQASMRRPQLVFKHSTRCGISRMVWSQSRAAMERLSGSVDLHFLDLLAYRAVSDRVAREFGVNHESPQVLLISDGKVIAHASHSAIPTMDYEAFLK